MSCLTPKLRPNGACGGGGFVDENPETLASNFSWCIMPFLANIFRYFIMQKDLKLAPVSRAVS
jgi:hypothetical protein